MGPASLATSQSRPPESSRWALPWSLMNQTSGQTRSASIAARSIPSACSRSRASPRNRPPSPTAYQAPSGLVDVDVMVAPSSPGPVLAASAVNARRAWNGLGYWSTVTTPVAASLLVLRAGVGARPDRQGQLAGGRVERGGEQEDGRGAHGVAGPSVAPRGLGLYSRNPDSVGGRAESRDTVNQFERRPGQRLRRRPVRLAWVPARWLSAAGLSRPGPQSGLLGLLGGAGDPAQPQVHRLHGVEPPREQEGRPAQPTRGVDLVTAADPPTDRVA